MNFLKKIAPFLGAALSLGGPLGAMAGNALNAALGAKPGAKVDDVLSSLTKTAMTPEQVTALQQAEQSFQLQMEQMKITSIEEMEKMADGDRADARQMQVQTRAYLPAIIAVIVVGGFLALLSGMMFGKLKVSDNQALLLLLGHLSGGFTTVLAFYFGSSAGSDRKTELMAQQTQPPK